MRTKNLARDRETLNNKKGDNYLQGQIIIQNVYAITQFNIHKTKTKTNEEK